MIVAVVAALVSAYLIGSINFAVIFSNIFMKRDVRELGSGNAGATNVLRNGGFLPGLLTFIFDALKGFIAVYIGWKLFEYAYSVSESQWLLPIYGAYACGTLCMIGHVFPIFFQFRGGKGVATSVGIFSVCCPIAIISGLVTFAAVLAVSKFVSLASVIATVVVVSFSLIFYETDALFWPQLVFVLIMGATVILKHSENIKRLIAGTESKIGRAGKK